MQKSDLAELPEFPCRGHFVQSQKDSFADGVKALWRLETTLQKAVTVCERAHRRRDTASLSATSLALNLTGVSYVDGMGGRLWSALCCLILFSGAIQTSVGSNKDVRSGLWVYVCVCVCLCPSLCLSVVCLKQFPVKRWGMNVKDSSLGTLLPLRPILLQLTLHPSLTTCLK